MTQESVNKGVQESSKKVKQESVSNVTQTSTDELTREELLSKLAEYQEEDLRMALKAAEASCKTREKGIYFLHYLFEENRMELGESGDAIPVPMEAEVSSDVSSEGKKAIISIPVAEMIMNPGKMVHGGVTALLCDNAMGMASFMSAKRPGVTLDLSVRYHLPGRGTQLTATGEVVHAGGQINSTRCEVRDDQGNLVATATGSFYHSRKRS